MKEIFVLHFKNWFFDSSISLFS